MAKTAAHVCIAVCALTLISMASAARADLPFYDDIGGEFSAKSTLNRSVSVTEFKGKAILLFFGYTSCQDICPAAMSRLRALMSDLGPVADSVQVLFVTVDPENDTAENLAEYLGRFDSRFVGLTGSSSEIASIASLYMAKHDKSHDTRVTTAHHRSKTFTDEAFQYAHSQQIYLLDEQGRTRALFFVGTPLEEIKNSIQLLLGSNNEGEEK